MCGPKGKQIAGDRKFILRNFLVCSLIRPECLGVK
jgi:hypothetical protein